MLIIAQCFVILLFAYTFSSSVEKITIADEDIYRLPGTILPDTYSLTLTLPSDIFNNNIFNGILNLTIKPLNETDEIKLHAKELQFLDIKLTELENGTEIPLKNDGNFQINPITDILTLISGTKLLSEKHYKIYVNYTGRLRTEDMYGFYRSEYTENGEKKYLATTQFESTHARSAFPCFDEPHLKAKFLISVIHSSNLTALGNTPVTSKTSANGMTTTSFEQTPIMSTYLVVFVVSELTCQESTTDLLNIPHQICSRESFKALRTLALDIGPKLLNHLEEFTQIKYNFSGIKKIDQVAIPDFAAGAMENWGLTTYRETNLLWDENESSNIYKQAVVKVVAHELTHMWFGDLVTMRWWSDTFLNEGFATYFEYFITAEVKPEWDTDKQFVLEELHPVLKSDALQSSKPLSFPVSSPSEISARFGSISYNKGGSIFRMVANFLGNNNFKNGLNRYLRHSAFGNSEPEQLWTALQEFAPSTLPEQLTEIMKNWVTAAGYPLLRINNNGTNIIISQERFLTDGGIPNKTEKWYVPISYTTSRDSNKFESTLPKSWLLPSDTHLTLENVLKDENDWIILNNQQTSYYRVSYSDDLLKRISRALSKPAFSGIHSLNRAQLIDDFDSLAKAGPKTYAEFLEFLVFLKKDTSYFPWYSALTAFSGMLQRIKTADVRQLLYDYIAQLIEVLYNEVPFGNNKDENQIYTLKKVLALTWACKVGIADCIENSLASFKKYQVGKIKPNPNLRSVVYCNGLRYSNDINRDWNFLWSEYGATTLATEQVTILTALGCAKDKTILTNYLNMSLNSSSGIRQQDALYVFTSVYSGNPTGVDIAAQFLYNNHKILASHYGSMNSKVSLINGLVNRFTTKEQISKLQKFTEIRDLDEELRNAALTALNTSEANLSTTKKLEEELQNYFIYSSAPFLKIEMSSIIIGLLLSLYILNFGA